MGLIRNCIDACRQKTTWCWIKIQSFSGWMVSSILFILLLATMSSKVTISAQDWSLFFGADLPRTSFKLGALFVVGILLAWIMPGVTIKNITQVENPDVGEIRHIASKVIALLFYLGVLSIAGTIIRGGV